MPSPGIWRLVGGVDHTAPPPATPHPSPAQLKQDSWGSWSLWSTWGFCYLIYKDYHSWEYLLWKRSLSFKPKPVLSPRRTVHGPRDLWPTQLSCGRTALLAFLRLNSPFLLVFTLVLCLVTQSCPTLCDPMDCSPAGSSVHGILQARVLEWVAMPSSRGIFPTQGLNPGLPHCRQILYHLSHQDLSHNKSDMLNQRGQFFKQLLFFPLAFWNLHLRRPPLGISNNKTNVNCLLEGNLERKHWFLNIFAPP